VSVCVPLDNMLVSLFASFCLSLINARSTNNPPNILFILADDLGWANVGFHNEENTDISTPHIDKLVNHGLELNRHYVYAGCSPTRAAMQSGRLPVHVNLENDEGLLSPTHGIPTRMTTVASKLKDAGYGTHMIGKWDCGMATFKHLPLAKGYDTFYGYLSKSIDYFTKQADNDCNGVFFADLWENDGPATSLEELDRTTFVEYDFRDRVIDLIDSYADSETPFFIVYSMHLPHYPSQIPEDQYEVFEDDENMCGALNTNIWPGFTDKTEFMCRSVLQSQVNLMDRIVGQVVTALDTNGLYDDTLIVFASDNGGSLELDSTAGNNYPLRGGKSSNLEGGIRSTAFVSGGYLPVSRRGDIELGLIHIADWYATFCALAGVDAADTSAEEHGLPAVDALDMWPLISGETDASPRTLLPISDSVLIEGDYKLALTGEAWGVWQGIYFPNSSTPEQDVLEASVLHCTSRRPCLFNVAEDPGEHVDISGDEPHRVTAMTQTLKSLRSDFYTNTERGTDSCAPWMDTETYSCGCLMAFYNWGHFSGPYQNLDHSHIHFTLSETDSDETRMAAMALPPNYDAKRFGLRNYILYVMLSVLTVVLLVMLMHYCQGVCSKSSIEHSHAIINSETRHVSYGTIL